ncbi:MAG: fibronectin type III domain-containing protein [Tepidisphaeraceae bacterium]
MLFGKSRVNRQTRPNSEFRIAKRRRVVSRACRQAVEPLESRVMLSGNEAFEPIGSWGTDNSANISQSYVHQLTLPETKSSQVISNASTAPQVTSVTATPVPVSGQSYNNWDFTIGGTGFGTNRGSGYVHIYDVTQNFNAGRPGIPGDLVTVNYTGWGNNQITIGGFNGSYGNSLLNYIAKSGDTAQVTVYNGSGGVSGTYTLTLPQGIPTTPGAPTASNVSPTGATISWAPSTAPSGYNISYTLQYNPGGGEIITSGTSVTLGGLTPETNYSLQLYASDSAGSSSMVSNSFTTANPTPITPGTPVASNVTPTSATVTWAASTAVGGETIAYTVQVGGQTVGSTFATSMSLTGLTPATPYSVRVQASDIVEGTNYPSSWSPSGSFNTLNPIPTTPGTPTASNVSPTGATISWAPSSAPSGYNISYTLQYNPGGGETITSGTSVTLGGLAPKTAYSLQLYATDSAGSSNTVTNSFTTADPTPTTPGTPTVSNITPTGASVSWGASTAVGGESIAYTVQIAVSSILPSWQTVGSTFATSMPMTGLTPNTAYLVRVQASDIVEGTNYPSSWSPNGSFNTLNPIPTTPGPPTASNVSPTGAIISWTPSTAPSGYNISYTLTYNPGGGEIITSGTSVTVGGLGPKTTYSLQLYATDSAGSSSTVTNSFTTADPTPVLAAPSIGDSMPTSATANWLTPTSTIWGSVPSGETFTYNVRWGQQGTSNLFWPSVTNISSTSYPLENLVPGQPYEVDVQAIGNLDGQPFAGSWVSYSWQTPSWVYANFGKTATGSLPTSSDNGKTWSMTGSSGSVQDGLFCLAYQPTVIGSGGYTFGATVSIPSGGQTASAGIAITSGITTTDPTTGFSTPAPFISLYVTQQGTVAYSCYTGVGTPTTATATPAVTESVSGSGKTGPIQLVISINNDGTVNLYYQPASDLLATGVHQFSLPGFIPGLGVDAGIFVSSGNATVPSTATFSSVRTGELTSFLTQGSADLGGLLSDLSSAISAGSTAINGFVTNPVQYTEDQIQSLLSDIALLPGNIASGFESVLNQYVTGPTASGVGIQISDQFVIPVPSPFAATLTLTAQGEVQLVNGGQDLELDADFSVRLNAGVGFVLPTDSTPQVSTISNPPALDSGSLTDLPTAELSVNLSVGAEASVDLGFFAADWQYQLGQWQVFGTSGNNGLQPQTPQGFGTLTVSSPIDGSAQPVGSSQDVGFMLSLYGQASFDAKADIPITNPTPTVNVTDAGGPYTGLPYAATGTVIGVNGANLGPPTFAYYLASDTTFSNPLRGAPADAGTYVVIGSFGGNSNYNAAQSAPVTFTIAKATPTVSVTDAGGSYTGSPFLASGSVTGVNSANIGTPAFTYYLASDTTFSNPLLGAPANAGNYDVVASYAGNTDYTAASASVSFTITPAQASVNLSSLNQTYDGTAKSAMVQTIPANLSVSITYSQNGNPVAAPTNAGNYTVVALIDDPNYQGGATGTLMISPATPTINVTDAGGPYTGSPYHAAGSVIGINSVNLGLPTFAYYPASDTTFSNLLPGAPASPGTYVVVGSFAGNGNYSAAQSSPVTFTVQVPAGFLSGSGATYTFSGSPGAQTLDVSSGTVALNSDLSSLFPNYTLQIEGGAVVVLTSDQHVGGMQINGNGSLDVANNTMWINYGSNTDPISTIAAYIKSGYNDGSWTGPGIDSSAAALSKGAYGVGFADGADGVVQGLSNGQIELKYTLNGDANLDGVVNAADINILAANFNKNVTGWDRGDFNYDGLVNAADFSELAANFNQGVNLNASGLVAGSGAIYTITGSLGAQTLDILSGTVTLTSDLSALLPKYSLKIETGANVVLASDQHIGALQLVASGNLDVRNYTVFINYGSNADPIAAIAGYIKSGYNGGGWNGPGIISTAARTPTNSLLYALGYADGKDGVVSGLSSGQIEIKYTRLGDANLDGLVNAADFTILAANFNQSVTGWDQGDFNYDGLVNAADFTDLAANFNQGASGASVAWSAAVQAVPVASIASTVTSSTTESMANTSIAPAAVSAPLTVATITSKSTTAAPTAPKSKPVSVSKAVIDKGKPKTPAVTTYAANIVTVPSAGSVAVSQNVNNKDAKFLADR